jgi:hypothetical protein
MNDIVAFFSRCLLYTVFVVVSKFENMHTEFDMFERVVLTCLQICVLCAAWLVYECCAFIIRSVSRPQTYEHVLDTREKIEQSEDLLKTEAVAKPESLDGDTRITFENSGALRKYITQVHLVGIVLWSTMLCSDYALDQTAFMFLLGMLLGNVATVAFKVHEKNMRAGKMRMYAVYWALIGVLVVMYLVHDGSKAIQYTEGQLGLQPSHLAWTDALWLVNVLLSPLSCGCTWTFWVDANTLLEHYPTSIYTSLLLSIPVLMSVDRAYISSLSTRHNALLTVHLFVTEPVLKFMTIYVLTLSLEVESVVDVLVVNAAVTGICYVIFSAHSEVFDAVVGFMITLLLLFHIARLVLRVMRQRKNTLFVVE